MSYSQLTKAFSCVILLLFTYCNHSQNYHKQTRAVYYWKTRVNWSEQESGILQLLGIGKIYLRMFDMIQDDSRQSIRPDMPVEQIDLIPGDVTIVPVVYITLEALRHMPDSELSAHASGIVRTVSSLMQRSTGQNNKYRSRQPFTELQIDCDWTVSTRERYFTLLKEIKQQVPDCIVSATIRLHQIKYAASTGIPPVDRGMLMVYNMGHPKYSNVENSIFNYDLVASYTQTVAMYPLPLDRAFPLFSWAVLYKQGNYKRLIRNIDDAAIAASSHFKKSGKHRYRALEACTIGDATLERGDELRFDKANDKELVRACNLLNKRLYFSGSTISLFSFANITGDYRRAYKLFKSIQ
jgi:hypothetical protein